MRHELGYTVTGGTAHLIADPVTPARYTPGAMKSVCGCAVLTVDGWRARIAEEHDREVPNSWILRAEERVDQFSSMGPCGQCTRGVKSGRQALAARELTPELRRAARAELVSMVESLANPVGALHARLRHLRDQAAQFAAAHRDSVARADRIIIDAVGLCDDHAAAALALGLPVHEVRAAVMRQWQRDHHLVPR